MSLTNAQREDRKRGLGGSDAPTCAGISPYKSPLELFYEKTGQIQPDEAEKECLEWGTRLEPLVADVYAEKTGRKIRRQPTRTHPEHPWMLGNVDRQIIGDSRGPGLLEVKTTNTFSAKDWENGPTDAAMLQLQHYLAIYGYRWGSIAVLIAGQSFRYFDVERDDELIHYLIQIEGQFWARVQRNDPPTEGWTPQTVDLLKRLYPRDNGVSVDLGDEGKSYIEHYCQAKIDIEAAEHRKAEAEGWIKEKIAGASLATAPGWNISWKSTKDGKKFDLDRFQREHPDLFAQYQTTKPGHRVFRVTPTKELIKS